MRTLYDSVYKIHIKSISFLGQSGGVLRQTLCFFQPVFESIVENTRNRKVTGLEKDLNPGFELGSPDVLWRHMSDCSDNQCFFGVRES